MKTDHDKAGQDSPNVARSARSVKARLYLAVRILLGLAFCVSGLLKTINHDLFAKALTDYSILPEMIVDAAALVLPPLETGLGLMTACGMKRMI